MNLSLIVVAVDFSDCSANALKYARELAGNNKCELVLMHVIDSRKAACIAQYTKEPVEKVRERLTNQTKQTFRKFLSEWDGEELVKETLVSYGPPFQEIAVKARELQADLILMGGYGSRGKGQIDEIFFGSTVEKVIRLLPCPVLCVPIGWELGAS
ncbi:MAG TPA: universal stress protein [Thermodesulfobacteriaceae bacterium]|nr:universal stress protein [Thermodesulfobacteriaceae bacterium]